MKDDIKNKKIMNTTAHCTELIVKFSDIPPKPEMLLITEVHFRENNVSNLIVFNIHICIYPNNGYC